MSNETIHDAMQCLTQGVYVIGVAVNGKENGMTAAWLTQISSRPNTLLVAIRKTHYTAQMICESRSFSVSVLSEEQDGIARTCGFSSGRNTDKLSGVGCTYSAAGNPLIPGAAAGMECVRASKIVMDPADAVEVCDEFASAGVELAALIDITWVIDSLKYVFINKLRVPTVLWAVPYTETFSIGCVQHFGSILKRQDVAYEYVYGLPDDPAVVNKLSVIAKAASIVRKVGNMNIALAGPRQTWRVAGPQDMSNEEWEFSKKFGTTILHIEMSEILAEIEKISDASAEKALDGLMKHSGKSDVSHGALVYAARVYLAVKGIRDRYHLDAMAAECYPDFGGLMNLPASWLADEGFILDTEGDIGHSVVTYMLNLCSEGPTVLGEIGSYDTERNLLAVAHEGSSAVSYAENLSLASINPSGELHTFVGFPLKPMAQITLASMTGADGCYQMLVAGGSSVEVTHQEWVDGGSKLVCNIRPEVPVQNAVDTLLGAGMDHHLLIKQGDQRAVMSTICKYLGIKEINF